MRKYLPSLGIFFLTLFFYTAVQKEMKKDFPIQTAQAQLQLQPFYPTATPTPAGGIPPTNTPHPVAGATSTPTPAPYNKGNPIATNTPTPPSSDSLDCLINSVSEQKLREYITSLTTSTRVSGSGGNNSAGDYIKNYFSSQGMESDFQPFSGKVSSRNTIGRISGTTLPKEFYLITAHMDSISPQASIKAPGADDNGTGTALLMEAARVFKACNFPLKRSVELVGFSGEEQYLVGSYYYVHNLPSQQVKNIKGVINIDMVGNDKEEENK
jgi:hypothetical protein